VSGYELFEHPS